MDQRCSQVPFQPYIEQLDLHELPSIQLVPGAVVFVVGPNNGGKSTFLNEIFARLSPTSGTKWISRVQWGLGTEEDYRGFVSRSLKPTVDGQYLRDSTGNTMQPHAVYGFYTSQVMHGGGLFLVRLLNAQSRITLADRVQAPDVVSKNEQHPYHRFFYSAESEADFSTKIRTAFNKDFRINRTGSQTIGHLGVSPKGDRLSVEYEEGILTKMQPVDTFGDGVRSYTGILLNSSADRQPVTVIDEPEAFLHPPQARRLGREIAAATKDGSQQVFVATHSSDFIQGALAAKNPNTFFLYLDHANKDRPLFSIDRAVVEEFSKKPFLAHTNALDALFYDQAIICEGEADIMFFKWALEGTSIGRRLEESFWISAYGKEAIPGILEDMQKLGIKARCVFDLDVLLTPHVLRRVGAAIGVDLSQYNSLLDQLAKAIKVPPAAESLEKISGIISQMADDEPSRVEAVRDIKRSADALGKSWVLKSSGVAALPKGDLNARVRAFLAFMRHHGVVILEEGEIENYVPEVGGHGQAWVRAALDRGSVPSPAKKSLQDQFKSLT